MEVFLLSVFMRHLALDNVNKLIIKNHNESCFRHKIKRSLYAMNRVRSDLGPWLRVFKSVKWKCSCARKRQQTYSGIDESCFGDKIKRSWSATNLGISRNTSLV